MAGPHSQHRSGIALVVAAAVAWSTAAFFTRLLPFDSWTILFWRAIFGGGLIAAILVLMQGRAGLRDLTGMGGNGWLVASLSTVGMVCFIPALQLTSVSNVAIIIATGPFVAAAFAWLRLGEAARWQTMLASLVALCGVAIIVGNVSASSDIIGIALACFMTVAIAAMTVTVRRHKNTPMVAAAALSNLLGSVVSIPFAHGIASVTGHDLVILCDVRVLPGRVGVDPGHAGIAAVALRTGHPDRYPGDTADAVLDMAGVPGDSFHASAGWRRRGDGSRRRRHPRRHQGTAATKLKGRPHLTANGA